jgi:glycosyltransferase involved in cell wall biosynthesis
MAIPSVSPPHTAAEPGAERIDVSVVIPVLDEAETVQPLADQVTQVLDEVGRSCEVIFVDDGSRDSTVERVRQAHAEDGRVHLVRLRRNFGKAAALCAGFDVSHGDLVVTMDGDLQDDPSEIPTLIEKLESEDLDLVSGWKQQRQDPISKRLPSKLFNWVTRKLARIDLALQEPPASGYLLG